MPHDPNGAPEVSSRLQAFTLVFAGDLRSFTDSPFKTETPYGIPIGAGMGDAFAEIRDLEGRLAVQEERGHGG